MEKSSVSGIALDVNLVQIIIIGIPKEYNIYKLFYLLSEKKIAIDMLVNFFLDYKNNLSFTVSTINLDDIENIFKNNEINIEYDDIIINKDVAKVSIVGDRISTDSTISERIFKSIRDNNIDVTMVSTCQTKISVVVPKKIGELSINCIHDDLAKVNLI